MEDLEILVKKLISEGKTEEALKKLIDKYQKKEVLLLANRLSKLSNEKTLGVIKKEDERIELNRINSSIIDFLDKAKDKGVNGNITFAKKNLTYSISLLVFILVVTLLGIMNHDSFRQKTPKEIVADTGMAFLENILKLDYEAAKKISTQRTREQIDQLTNYFDNNTPQNHKVIKDSVQFLGNKAILHFHEESEVFFTSMFGYNIDLILEDGKWIVDIDRFWFGH